MKTAQFYLPMKDGKTPQLFYRIATIKWNDGTESQVLQYLSTCGGGWMNSDENKNKDKFIKERLLKVN
jgi:hypothetical protein